MRTTAVLIMTAVLGIAGCSAPQGRTAGQERPYSERLRPSLVNLEVSAYSYEQFQPWKTADLTERTGFGVAVGPRHVLTTAWNVADAAYIRARRYAQNDFITATVAAVDYDANLCLLELDPNAVDEPLTPVTFEDRFERGAEADTFWLSSAGDITTGRGTLDTPEIVASSASFAQCLNFVASNAPRAPGYGALWTLDETPIGITVWNGKESGRTGIIPAETINAFLADAMDGAYAGFGAVGFAAHKLLDPTLRAHLEMPANVTEGVYVARVFTLGTGSDVLKKGDVLLGIDGRRLDAHGRYEHPLYERLTYHHLITGRPVGEAIAFDVWRAGERVQLTAKAQGIRAADMLVPWYEYGEAPRYMVVGGYILQRLTRSYLTMWGDDFGGKAPPHLVNYFENKAFDASDERREVVLLSYVLPHQINLGYHTLGRLVIESVNGRAITCFDDVVEALETNEGEFHVLEFELDNPTVVIPRGQVEQANAQIMQLYGIPAISNLSGQ